MLDRCFNVHRRLVTNDPSLEKIRALMQAGRLVDAERLCRRRLSEKAPHPEHFHYALGFIFMTRRDLVRASRSLQDAVSAAPFYTEALHALAFVFKDLGDSERAVITLTRAAECPGAGADILCNLGLLRRERGENRLAIAALRRAVALDRRSARAWQALGLAHRALNESDEAITALRQAIECDRRNPAAHLALGTLFLDLDRPEAVEVLAEAARLDAASATTAERYARALARAQRFEEAIAEHERARRLAPDVSAHLLSHAASLAEAGRVEDADTMLQGVIASATAPVDDKARAHHELAVRSLARNDVAAARAHLDEALMLAPGHDDIRLRRAMLLLSLGEFDPGWREFESRFGTALESGGAIHTQPFPQPRWSGWDLRDQAILVWGEQGIGDDIVAASMLPDLAARAREVLVHTDGRLEALFLRSLPANVRFFPRVLPVQAELLSERIACQIPLGGLGEFLRPSWRSFGTPRAYLRADPAPTDDFRRRYSAFPGLKIGIAWRSKNLVNGRIKSTQLTDWEPVLRTLGVTFINLQYGDCADELAEAKARFGCDIRNDLEVDQLRDMDRFAAQVASLDGVISVSNAVAHTAGALGVPTAVLLATDPLWLWFRERSDSPWYPRVRLFRQARAGDWSVPMVQVAAALAAWPPASAAAAR